MESYRQVGQFEVPYPGALGVLARVLDSAGIGIDPVDAVEPPREATLFEEAATREELPLGPPPGLDDTQLKIWTILDRPTPFDDFDRETDALVGHPEIPLAIRYFGGAGLAHMQKYGTSLETFAQVRAKASRHAVNNPLALFRKEVTVDDVLASPVLMPGVMTRLMACPPTCGAAAWNSQTGGIASGHRG